MSTDTLRIPSGHTPVRLRAWLAALQPAVFCLSTVLLMLGISLTLIALLAVWLRTPEQLVIHPLPDDAAIIHGGESIAAVLGYVRHEVASSALLALGGLAGVLIARPADPGELRSR